MANFIKIFLTIFFLWSTSVMAQQNTSFPVYTNNDLGISWSNDIATLKIWAPLADSVLVEYFGHNLTIPIQVKALEKGNSGIWNTKIDPNWGARYYRYLVKNKIGLFSTWTSPITDPYAIAVSPNGTHAAIINLSREIPIGWEKDRPLPPMNHAAAVIYELHIRDVSSHASAGIANKRKYIGLTERGTVNSFGQSTGLDHLIDLGITHVHLLPVFDFKSSNEVDSIPPYNWGYDPFHYNTPEGSFATHNEDPATRIKEFRQLIQALHQRGIRVVMDVVYNHTAQTENAAFEQIVPGYYYRKNSKGEFSNASACGNETASERPMFRQFMLQSLLHWVKEYHIDGFRFDLMGIHDISTMNFLADSLRKINPGILLYGEGWTAGSSPLPDSTRALKQNVTKLSGIAVFGDEFRDGLKGSVFDISAVGWLGGNTQQLYSVLFGLVGGVKHPNIDYQKVNYSKGPLSTEPRQLIAYADCHDNHTLWDRLSQTHANLPESIRINMHKQALTAVLLSQSPSFLQAGTEFLRTKNGVENSFESPDSINAIDWNLKFHNREVYSFVKSLIDFKKTHPAFQLSDPSTQVRFNVDSTQKVVGYFINAQATNDVYEQIHVWFNTSSQHIKIDQPEYWKEKGWKLLMADHIFLKKIKRISNLSAVELAPHQTLILVKSR
jgi:pullulanase